MSEPVPLNAPNPSHCCLAWEGLETASYERPPAASGLAVPRPAGMPQKWQQQQCSLRHVCVYNSTTLKCVPCGGNVLTTVYERSMVKLPSFCLLLAVHRVKHYVDCAR
eukprot:681528-Pelagomonas_calceolata.AAC.6